MPDFAAGFFGARAAACLFTASVQLDAFRSLGQPSSIPSQGVLWQTSLMMIKKCERRQHCKHEFAVMRPPAHIFYENIEGM